MRNLALLILRLTFGGLQTGHGAQKLFGSFGGPGIEGTAGWLESLGIKPGRPWAYGASLSEFGGGVLTGLGLFYPISPILTLGAASVATFRVHAGKPIWVTAGGAELPVTNMAIALALALDGPGDISLDRLLGTQLPRWMIIPGLIGVGTGVAYILRNEISDLLQGQTESTTAPAVESTPSSETAPTA